MSLVVRAALVSMLLPVFLVAQKQQADRRLQVGVDRSVDIGARTVATVEPYLAINPTDPKHMVASVSLANQMGDPRRSDGGGGTITCAALASFDAGETWQRHDFPGRSCLDSWVAMLRDGLVVFLAQEGSELITFRSTTGGRTWADTPGSLRRDGQFDRRGDTSGTDTAPSSEPESKDRNVARNSALGRFEGRKQLIRKFTAAARSRHDSPERGRALVVGLDDFAPQAFPADDGVIILAAAGSRRERVDVGGEAPAEHDVVGGERPPQRRHDLCDDLLPAVRTPLFERLSAKAVH